jgi:hypothetical protein
MFALFRQASDQGHLSMLQDWVLSALPNFSHRSPLSHSIWCLTVFFVCAATTNPHLQVTGILTPGTDPTKHDFSNFTHICRILLQTCVSLI